MKETNLKKQKEKILQRLEKIYGFTFIEDFISLEEILDNHLSYGENIVLLKNYLADELLISEYSKEISRAIGNERFLKLKEDLILDEFERLMTK